MSEAPHTITYVELSVGDLKSAKQFYSAALGWKFNDYGPQYAGIRSADGASEIGGLAAGDAGAAAGVLLLLRSDDVDMSAQSVVAAGGVLDSEIYPYPGGRRFTFVDLDGNRLGVFQQDSADTAG